MPQVPEYPDPGWSTGSMRMAKRPIEDPGYPIRELESQRKKRETKVSFDFSKMSDDDLQQHLELLNEEMGRRKNGANGT